MKRGLCAPCSLDGGGVLDAVVHGRDLAFEIPGSAVCAGGDYWWEPISADGEWFETCGTWTASVDDPRHIAGIHAGTFAYHRQISTSPPVHLYCAAPDHHFTLSRTTEN
jgi:hypothetical protein